MATREITQLPDRFTGDINNIRDKKIAEASDATAASDITSQCEYLIKNGQTGEFMNVLKSYIDESIRSALGALVSNLDKGTSISKVLATDANNDLGSITPANLASVLSAELNTAKFVTTQLNQLRTPGCYYAPDSVTGDTLFVVVWKCGNSTVQFVIYPSQYIYAQLRYIDIDGKVTIKGIAFKS